MDADVLFGSAEYPLSNEEVESISRGCVKVMNGIFGYPKHEPIRIEISFFVVNRSAGDKPCDVGT